MKYFKFSINQNNTNDVFAFAKCNIKDVPEKTLIKIGKDLKSNICINEEQVSRMHAVIETDTESATLIDLGNEPGSLVNGARVNKKLLEPGDIISFGGKTQIKYIGSEYKEYNPDANITQVINDEKVSVLEEKIASLGLNKDMPLDNSKKINNLKIYVTAAHSCGKSTLARYIAQHYQIDFISEVARMVLSEKELNLQTLRSNLDITDDYQWSVFERQLTEETKYSSFVSDRCFDFLAYSAQHSRIAHKIFADERFQKYIQSLKEQNVVVFFVRPSPATLREDGVREKPEWDSIVAIDAQIKLILEIYGIRYFQINSDSLQERIRLVDAVLALFLTK